MTKSAAPPRKAKTKTAASGMRISGSRTSSDDADGDARRALRGVGRSPAAAALIASGRIFMTRSFQIRVDDLLLRAACQPPKSAIRNGSAIVPKPGLAAFRLSVALRKPYFTKIRCASSLQRNCTKRSTSGRSRGRTLRSITTRVCSERIVRSRIDDVGVQPPAAPVVDRLLLVGDERVAEAVLELRARGARRGGLRDDVLPDPREHRLARGRARPASRARRRRTRRRSPSWRRPRSGDPGCTTRTPGRVRSAKSRMPQRISGAHEDDERRQVHDAACGSRFQLSARDRRRRRRDARRRSRARAARAAPARRG